MKDALKGKALLEALANHSKVSKSEAVRLTGYVNTKKDGTERLNFTAFYAAVLEAKGVVFGDSEAEVAPPARLSFVTTVHKGGAIHLGPAYAELMGVEPGETVRIAVKSGRMTLTPVVTSIDSAKGSAPEAAVVDAEFDPEKDGEIDEVDDGLTPSTFRELATAA